MARRYTSLIRFSRWDGSQKPQPDAGAILKALSEDLMEFGDLQQAMRYLMQRGLDTADGNYIKGLRDLLRQLKEQRRQRLERYDLGSIMEGIRQQLDEILDMERRTIDDWIARKGAQAQPDKEPSAQAQPDKEPNFSDQLLGGIGERNKQFIDQLPEDAAGQVKALQGYDFLNTDAQKKFLKLLEELRQGMAQAFFKDVQKMVNQMSDGDLARMKQMVKDLNKMLVKKIAGEDPGFEAFMQKYGDMFGDQPPKSLDELLEQMQRQMAATQSLLNSMSPEQQQQLQELIQGKFGDPELEAELAKLAKEINFLKGRQYDFSGSESLDLAGAMELMREMAALDDLEQQMQHAQYDGKMEQIDAAQLEELLGKEAAEDFEEMKKMLGVLEDAGYVTKEDSKWELTPRGARCLGQSALQEIYARLKRHHLGSHAVPEEGRFGERTEESRPYEFGDPFHLHMPRTIRNALDREGPGAPIRLKTDDFEIYRSETISRTATVLMVDLSWSMALRGSFQSAKKVALALHQLISAAYPRDSLYILGFSAYAKEIKAFDLPYLQYDDYLLGTNMQHALMLAEKLLAKHPQGTRQVIMITDGEPTAHLERGRPVFAYPPAPATISKTLQAVRRCTNRNITINTFMLDQSYYLKAFVEQMSRINGGRIFYAEPHNLGEYLLVDYVRNRRKRL